MSCCWGPKDSVDLRKEWRGSRSTPKRKHSRREKQFGFLNKQDSVEDKKFGMKLYQMKKYKGSSELDLVRYRRTEATSGYSKNKHIGPKLMPKSESQAEYEARCKLKMEKLKERKKSPDCSSSSSLKRSDFSCEMKAEKSESNQGSVRDQRPNWSTGDTSIEENKMENPGQDNTANLGRDSEHSRPENQDHVIAKLCNIVDELSAKYETLKEKQDKQQTEIQETKDTLKTGLEEIGNRFFNAQEKMENNFEAICKDNRKYFEVFSKQINSQTQMFLDRFQEISNNQKEVIEAKRLSDKQIDKKCSEEGEICKKEPLEEVKEILPRVSESNEVFHQIPEKDHEEDSGASRESEFTGHKEVSISNQELSKESMDNSKHCKCSLKTHQEVVKKLDTPFDSHDSDSERGQSMFGIALDPIRRFSSIIFGYNS